MAAPGAWACLWDSETLKEEAARLPGVREAIAGAFPRHSEHYHRWRVEDRLTRLGAVPGDSAEGLALRDDVAVSYDKLGRHEEAVAFARTTLALDAGRYESLANLGTLLIHAGELEEGLTFLREAVAVNPDAHFGREWVQIALVEWVLSGEVGRDRISPHGFHGWVLDRAGPLGFELDLGDAVVGVVGMMRFGTHDHPVLLEALGDLLSHQGDLGDAKRLATRAYLRAADAVGLDDPEEAARLRERAREALQLQTEGSRENKLSVGQVEARLAEEVAAGAALQARIAAAEAAWVEAGEDLDARYDAVYREAVVALPAYGEEVEPKARIGGVLLLALFVGINVIGLVGVLSMMARRRG